MTYTVTCFYNTGFNVVNIPDNPSIIETYEGKNFNAVFLKQDRDIQQIKLAATWDDIKDADYLRLTGDGEVTFYFILDTTMVNDNMCIVSLQEDVISSVGGIRNIDIIDGWATRLTVGDDPMFGNILPENFQPQNRLEISDMISIGDSTTENGYEFVGTTVALSSMGLHNAIKYKTDEGDFVAVPKTPPAAGKIIFKISDEEQNLKSIYPNQNIYDFKNDEVQQNVSELRSLGIESASITSCYTVPEGYVDLNNAAITALSIGTSPVEINSNIKTASNSITTNYNDSYTPKNQKVYAINNKIVLKSIASGEEIQYNVYEINNPDFVTAPIQFISFADLSPDGCPFARPKFYLGKPYKYVDNLKDYLFTTGIKGANWKNTPFTLVGSNQVVPLLYNHRIDSQINEMNANNIVETSGFEAVSGLLRALGGNANTASGYTGSGINVQPHYSLPKSGVNKVHMSTISPDSVGSGMGLNVIGAGMNAVASGIDLGVSMKNSGLALANAIAAKNKEKFAYEYAMNAVEPSTYFPVTNSLQNYVGNGFIAYRVGMSLDDIKRADKYFSRFGYTVSEPLTIDKLFTRTWFNYVEANGVYVDNKNNKKITKRRKEMIEAILSNGIRIWHSKPSQERLDDNPIVTQ